MLSFPSSLNQGGISAKHLGKSENSFTNESSLKEKSSNNASKFSDDIERMSALNINLDNNIVRASLVTPERINISNNSQYTPLYSMLPDNKGINGKKSLTKQLLTAENPFHIPSEIFGNINKYRFIYKHALESLYSTSKGKKNSANILTSRTVVSQSLFNPKFMVQSVGMDTNTPLLNNVHSNKTTAPKNPTIQNLCNDSLRLNSALGVGRFRYADFMFCKDLGKVPNNHLVVLRKFARPVGDNIFKYASQKYMNKKSPGKYDFSTEEDIGRLITWFDTDDVKLEDLVKYDYSMSWKELTAKRQWKDSKEDNDQRGIAGFLANMNPQYNSMMEGGYTGSHNILSAIGSHFGMKHVQSDNMEMLGDYDNNKVYTPLNTVQDTNVYEGRLKTNQEFTIKFSYKLRGYDNINAKSAMLDLIGNILEVTYRRGTFWGGSRHILGPSPNPAAWKKANTFIDNSWSKLGGVFGSIESGQFNFTEMLGSISNAVTQIIAAAGNTALNMVGMGSSTALSAIQQGGIPAAKQEGKDAVKDAKHTTQHLKNKVESKGIVKTANETAGNLISTIAQGLGSLNNAVGLSSALKGALKGVLGRPAMYAWDSLLSGDNVGQWHLTVGNPYNPIISLGNLIMTGATIEQMGPLGIDDFPSELVVTVKLKTGRSRDLTELEQMYTRGMSAIYLPIAGNNTKYYIASGDGKSKDIEAETFKIIKEQMKSNAEIDKENDKMVKDWQSNHTTTTTDEDGNEVKQEQSPGANDIVMKDYKDFSSKYDSLDAPLYKNDSKFDNYDGQIPYDSTADIISSGLGGSNLTKFVKSKTDIYGNTSIRFDTI